MENNTTEEMEFYDYVALDPNDNEIKMESFIGKVLVICNIASDCGFASKNYKNFEGLREKFDKNQLEFLLFPCNQFLGQEPHPYETIRSKIDPYFKDYVLFKKVDVKGKNEHKLYKFLKKQKGGLFSNLFMWNFTKFIIDTKGNVVKRLSSNNLVKEETIEKLLAEKSEES